MPLHKPPWYLVPFKAALVTFVLTAMSFAISLLLGILGMVIGAKLRGVHPNMALAYRNIALPIAAIVGGVVCVSATAMEIRDYRQRKALIEIESASR
jgi:hypothetical protein